MIRQTYLLREPKKLAKLCKLIDRDFKCREVYQCRELSACCPLSIANEVEFLMNLKNLTIGEAYKQAIQSSISKTIGNKVVTEFMHPLQEYNPADMLEEAKNKLWKEKDGREKY